MILEIVTEQNPLQRLYLLSKWVVLKIIDVFV